MPDIRQRAHKMFDDFLYQQDERWYFCEDGAIDGEYSQIPTDCACCLDNGLDQDRCGCVCHKRISKLKSFIDEIIDMAVAEERKIDENTSDGYHTFKELYGFRKIYNACLFNEWAKQGKYSVHKSKTHSDGELCFGGGWFIVMATLPDGDISNHYEMKDWDLFECEEREKAKEWDGHTSQDVVSRLLSLIKEPKLSAEALNIK